MTLRAVIAGATGLIGSNLAEHLVSKGIGPPRTTPGGSPASSSTPAAACGSNGSSAADLSCYEIANRE